MQLVHTLRDGLAGILFASASQSAAALEWRPLAELADDPELPGDDHAEALAEALPGCSVCGVATRDASVMLLVVTMPPEADDERAPRWGEGRVCLKRMCIRPVLIILAVHTTLTRIIESAEEKKEVRTPRPPCTRASAAPMLRASSEALMGLLHMRRARDAHVSDRRAKAAKSWRILRTLARMGMLRRATETAAAAKKMPGQGGLDGGENTAVWAAGSGCLPIPGAVAARTGAWVRKVARKWRGAGAKPMPADSNEKSAYTLLFVFVTLIILTALNRFVVAEESRGEYTIVLGSMGALCTLLYSAPNSPLAQPRNVFFGHVVAGAVGALVNVFTVVRGGGGNPIQSIKIIKCDDVRDDTPLFKEEITQYLQKVQRRSLLRGERRERPRDPAVGRAGALAGGGHRAAGPPRHHASSRGRRQLHRRVLQAHDQPRLALHHHAPGKGCARPRRPVHIYFEV
jgi:hypothetical protein